jgi:hypothetical protein
VIGIQQWMHRRKIDAIELDKHVMCIFIGLLCITNNVFLYFFVFRLISERTIEESILLKANQKRRLGEIAIEEAQFTIEFFKQVCLYCDHL